ncbi:guanine nucleotide exchange protein for ADP-robosylation factor [Coemansia guatemalensis]|uniref:Guanine nucleotide exchange protein for ADP-robosylation factor n=1 Tax=Coemansia guatemalensis TaxID=2761395 RepID=A0A9W8HYK0_9FUNG|nr:guanine nucleotide exchange protein for ADP-robosylation factor [Coemansia guatemalensis]
MTAGESPDEVDRTLADDIKVAKSSLAVDPQLILASALKASSGAVLGDDAPEVPTEDSTEAHTDDVAEVPKANGSEALPENDTEAPVTDSAEDGTADSRSSNEEHSPPQRQSLSQEQLPQEQPPLPEQQQQQPQAATPLPGLVFIIGAMEKLQTTREGRRGELGSAVEQVLGILRPRQQTQRQVEAGWLLQQDVETVIQALSLASRSSNAVATALDCVEKLVSYGYFDNIAGLDEAKRNAFQRTVAERLVALVAGSFAGESTADAVQLQIVKALFALLSSERLPVRQAAMLATIRTAHNVFVLARSPSTQTIAQGTLTQMVHMVLARVRVEEDGDLAIPGSTRTSRGESDLEQEGDAAARDAFLLIRALCKLSMRAVANDHVLDVKSPQLRSRCLALNLIRLALTEHAPVFTSAYVHLRPHAETRAAAQRGGDEFDDLEGPDQAIEQMASSAGQAREAAEAVAVPLVAVVRQHLSLSLSRNLASSNPLVLELSLRTFELALGRMRMFLRHETEVLFREILLPVLESRSPGSLAQRGRMLQALERLLAQPQLAVELYLNYDCAEDSVNVFQRLAEALCRLSGLHVGLPPKNSPAYALAADIDSEGATASAWRAVQQRPTVFNAPAAQVAPPSPQQPGDVSAWLGEPGHRSPGVESVRRRHSRTFSISSQGTAASSTAPSQAAAALAYGGLAFAPGEKNNAGQQTMDEYAVRQLALSSLGALLQSMVAWSDRLADPVSLTRAAADTSADAAAAAPATAPETPTEASSGADQPADAAAGDDPQSLMSIRSRKAQFDHGRRLFAWKPQKGIEAWRAAGHLTSNDPQELGRLLYASRDGLNKVALGEYLGKHDPYNVAVMHTFVEQIDFSDMQFVAALRRLLQAFRLPGEAQMIDRFMLKFAERYVIANPNSGFANADAAYVLAYSVILLNTDQHSPQVRHRMSQQAFLANNRGINGGGDLDTAMLVAIYEEVARDEIKLKDDPLGDRADHGPAASAAPLFLLWGSSTADRIRELHAHASAEMAAKSEQSIRSMARMRRRRWAQSHAGTPAGDEDLAAATGDDHDPWALLLDMGDYLHATRAEHIAPMFGAIWTAVLAALSSPMQTSSDPHVVAACLIGFQCGIALSCRFRMPLERATFVTTLRNFTQLQNLAEMRRKHVEAIRALVEVSASRPDVGDGLAESWLDVLQCVSQLERLQLLTQGTDAAMGQQRSSATRASASYEGFGFASVLSVAAPQPQSSVDQKNIPARAFGANNAPNAPKVSVADLAKLETNSQVLVVLVDRLFTSSVHLSATGIVDFVRALSQVAWGEIAVSLSASSQPPHAAQNGHRGRRSSSGAAPQHVPPTTRLFSMTKIVEIAYYNMERIRVEWSQIWAILGPLFDRVGAYSDARASVFALDSLRQLSMKFLEKEELPHFAFQKEFLRPFADILEGYVPDAASSNGQPLAVDLRVKDMVLRCVYQLVQAAAAHIRSGWKAVLNVAQIAARDAHDQIAEMGFHIARECAMNHGKQMWMLTSAQVPSVRDPNEAQRTVVAITGLEYFHELIDCLSEYAVGAAASRRPRFALGAIDTMYRAAVALGAQIMEHPQFEMPKPGEEDDVALDDQPLYRVWMPVLRALHEVVMHTDDLEVRTRALDAFFRLVMTQGRYFSRGLWAAVLRSLVFDLFSDLRDPSASRRFATVDDLELWFSSTLIKALQHLIALFTEYYPSRLSGAMMAEVLDLLAMCIAQPSEVLGKVGTSCLQDMVRSNYAKFDQEAWGLVCDSLAKLFNWSQPRELFSIAGASLEAESENGKPATSRPNGGALPNGENAALPVIAPNVKRPPAGTAAGYATNRPSPLRTGGSAASILSADGNETPSPASATPSSAAAAGPSLPAAAEPAEEEAPLPSPPPPPPAIGLAPQPVLLPRDKGPTSSSASNDKPDYVFITLKCILQLLLIQTVGELFGINVETGEALTPDSTTSDDLYAHMSAHHLFILLDCLDQSRSFAHRFNTNRKVRRRLVELGVMPSMPSLLKQETGSVLMELHILQRMHADAIGVSYHPMGQEKANGKKQRAVSKDVAKDRETVSEEVDDRMGLLTGMVLEQYCGHTGTVSPAAKDASESDKSKERWSNVRLVSSANAVSPSSTDAKKQMVLAHAWRPSVMAIIAFLPQIALVKKGADKPFRAAVAGVWLELVDVLGVAVDVGDRDIVGGIQKILAVAGAELNILS